MTWRRMVILTQGHSNPHAAKTACSLIRYRPSEVVAVLDSTQAPTTTDRLLGVGSAPVIARLDQAPQANTLVIGIAPPGGKIPPAWRGIILEAICGGMDVISGLHDFLGDDEELAAAAARRKVRLWDVRKNQEKTIARRAGLDDSVLRVHTVGTDCSVGKMVVALEVERALRERGRSAKFLATGQTGIMVAGEGVPIDCVVADFVSGAAEQLVLRNQQNNEFLLIEGQGSLVHPSYSGVTLSLLHGCHPQAMILCAQLGRTHVTGLNLEIPPLARMKALYETMASLHQPSSVIAIALNTASASADRAEEEVERLRAEFQLPACDVIRHGPAAIADAVEAFAARRAATAANFS